MFKLARAKTAVSAISGGVKSIYGEPFSRPIWTDNQNQAAERQFMTDTLRSQTNRDVQRAERRSLLAGLAQFQGPSRWYSIFQVSSTALAYVATVAAMYAALKISVWLTLAMSLLAAGLVVRLFIIQHDCGHGSYFRSPRANEVVGWLCSVVTFTPYSNWRRQHAAHHAVWNNLDERHGGSDIYSACLTLQEYNDLSPRRRWLYRVSRHPLVAQFILPPLVFLLLFRIPLDAPRTWRKERRGVYFTNLALAIMLTGLVALLGWRAVLLVQVPIMLFASIAGVWLFSVQHRFEDSEWLRQGEWTPMRAALNGSSYLKLPRVLQWFTGNIGFHHIHHLLPRVPNYRLESCHRALVDQGGVARTLTLAGAARAPSFALWDETARRMIPFPR
jgi:omega-6 fatty acid desaturase (delta-12 desaturase)